MREKTFQTEIKIGGELLRINTWGGEKACYVEVLQAIHREMDSMLSWHEKVLMVRVDIHAYADDVGSTNSIMTDYLSRMREWVAGKYNAKRLGYIWVRETSTNKGLHYHLWLMVDGNSAKSGHYFIEKSRQIVERHSHRGYRNAPYPPKSENGIVKKYFYLVRRGDEQTYRDAFYHASYLAKERTKDKHNLSPKGKNFSASRIKPNPKPRTIKTERQLPLF